MGYYTEYSMKVRNISKSESERLNDVLKEKDLIGYVFWDSYYDASHDTVEYSSYEAQKWYDCEWDMDDISKQFPNAVFELSGEGDEYGDIWREYFKNGKHEYCRGEIVYETPKEIEWDTLLVI